MRPRLGSTLLPLLAVLAVARPSPAAAQPSPPLDAEGVGRGGVPRCPPTPTAPVAEPARCGNGKVDVRYELVAAPCVPGSCCAQGWAPVPLEACDGDDLGGRTCATLGYLGGRLACTSACVLSTEACLPTAGAHLSATAEAPAGDGASLALNGKTLGVAAVDGTTLRFRAFDARTLAPLGPAREALGPSVGDVSSWKRRALLVPFRDGFLVAKGHGTSGALHVVTGAGELGPPRDAFPGSLPTFLATAGAGILVGLEPHVSGYPVELVRLDADGHPAWRPVRALDVARPSYDAPAAAARVGGEWVVASGSGPVHALDGPRVATYVARVTDEGAVRSVEALAANGVRSLAIATEGPRAVLVLTTGAGVFATELSPGERGATVRLAESGRDRYERVLAAELRGGVLTAYVSASRSGPPYGAAVASVHRVGARLPAEPSPPEVVFSAPGASPRAGLLADGVFFLSYADATGRALLAVWR